MSLSLGIGLGLTMQEFAPFIPSALFASGEEGSWHDPSDLTTLFQDSAGTTPVTADGQPVGRMEDKSGNGNHALQATASKRPTYKASAGLSWLDFDGVDDSMATGSIDFTAGDKMSVFAGFMKADQFTDIIMELSISSSAQNGVFALLFIDPDVLRMRSRGTITSDASAAGFATPVTSVVTGLGDISGDSSILRVDGSQAASNTNDQGSGNYSNNPLYIGSRASGTTNALTGKIYGLIVRGAASSVAEIGQTESYLAGKSGVVL